MSSTEESIKRGLAQSAAGDLVDLGDFTQYATSETTDAIKRAAEALREREGDDPNDMDLYVEDARAALTAALSDREGMARVMAEATSESGLIYKYTRRKHLRVADALAAHLLGGEDE